MDLFDVMASDVPSSRPPASEALDRVRRLVVSHDILTSKVPLPAPVPIKMPPCDVATEATLQRMAHLLVASK